MLSGVQRVANGNLITTQSELAVAKPGTNYIFIFSINISISNYYTGTALSPPDYITESPGRASSIADTALKQQVHNVVIAAVLQFDFSPFLKRSLALQLHDELQC